MPSTGLMDPYNVSISSEPHGDLLRQDFNPHLIFFCFVLFLGYLGGSFLFFGARG